MATKALTADLPEDIANKLEELSIALDQSKESIVVEALADWIELEERRHRKVLAGLADVDAGRLIDDADVAAWIESLDTDNPLPVPSPRR
jgi:predicted transcriptional regulator